MGQRQGGKGRGSVVAAEVERSVGLDSGTFFLAEVNLLNSVILCRLWCGPLNGYTAHWIRKSLGICESAKITFDCSAIKCCINCVAFKNH